MDKSLGSRIPAESTCQPTYPQPPHQKPQAFSYDTALRRPVEIAARRIDPHGFDGGKKIKGKKRHVLVDTQGLLMDAIVHSADIQDRDGGVLLMATLFGLYPLLLKLYADAGYQGPKFRQGLARVCHTVNIEIVRRCGSGTFVVPPRRWIVEHTIAWLNRSQQGLGVPQPKCTGIPPLGVGSYDVEKAIQKLNMISDRLLRRSSPSRPSKKSPANAAMRSCVNNGRMRVFTSRSDDAQSSNVVSIDAHAIPRPPNLGCPLIQKPSKYATVMLNSC